MKILYCITRSTWGGAQENIWELMKYEISLKNKVVLVVGEEGTLTDRVKSELPKVKLIILKTLQRNISLRRDLKAVKQFRKIVRDEKPDIVHLHSSKAGVVGRLACIGLKCKVIFTVHGWAFTDGVASKKKKVIFRYIEKCMTPLTDKIICVSKYDYNIGIRDHVIKKDGKAVVIHNGVKSTDFKRDFKLKKEQPLNLVMTARFSPQKNQIALIEAVSKLPSDKYNLIFVGDGPTMGQAQKLVNDLGLDESIKFAGFQSNVEDYLKWADIFVLSTHYEGLPISIIEAMNYSLPIIASDVGGNSELVDDNKNGFLISDIVDIVRSIKLFMNEQQLLERMGKASNEKFKREYVLNLFLSKTNSLYDHDG